MLKERRGRLISPGSVGLKPRSIWLFSVRLEHTWNFQLVLDCWQYVIIPTGVGLIRAGLIQTLICLERSAKLIAQLI